jgi:hypothetical protein
MTNRIKTTMLAGLAALTLTLGVEAPASAQVFHGHGGGFHGGFRGGYGYHGGYGYRGGWGPGLGLGIVGGLAAGALIAGSYPYYGYGYGYGGCYRPRPTYDAYGNYLGTHVVNVCY